MLVMGFPFGALFGVTIATVALAFSYPPRWLPENLLAALLFAVAVWVATVRLYTSRTARAISFKISRDPQTIFNAILAFFTAMLALITRVQVWAFITSERAALYSWTNNLSPLVPGQPITFLLNVTNTGHSTAYVIAGAETISFSKKALPEDPQYTKANATANLPARIPSGASISGTVTIKGENGKTVTLDQSAVSELKAGDMKLYIFGWIKYIDDFTVHNPVQRGFCGVFNPNGPPANDFENCGNPNYVY